MLPLCAVHGACRSVPVAWCATHGTPALSPTSPPPLSMRTPPCALQLVSAVTTAMKAHPTVEDVQCHCVGLLVALSSYRPLLKHMARAGCASAIAVAAHCYPEDNEVRGHKTGVTQLPECSHAHCSSHASMTLGSVVAWLTLCCAHWRPAASDARGDADAAARHVRGRRHAAGHGHQGGHGRPAAGGTGTRTWLHTLFPPACILPTPRSASLQRRDHARLLM